MSGKAHGVVLALLIAGATFGCGKGTPNDEAPGPTGASKLAVSKVKNGAKSAESPTTAPSINTDNLKRVSSRPANPMGRVFVAEYHHVKTGKGPMFRTTDAFSSDLARFYKDGFRPVTVAEYLSGKMPIGSGASPVVFTFDDADPSQFKMSPDGSIDPKCMIGLWQGFAKTHPDFPIKATFYILPNPWAQPKLIQQKLKFLHDAGCEIGNHTITHPILHKMTDEQVKGEIGGAELYIEKLGVPAPTSLAFPYGSSPKNKEILKGFEYQGKQIKLTNAMLVGAEPAPAPTDPKLNPYRIPRIQANNEPSGLDDWFTKFEAGKVKVYVQP